MPIGVQHVMIVMLLCGFGAWYVAAAFVPNRRYLRSAYSHFWRFALKWGPPNPLERLSTAVFGAMLFAAGLFVATLHVG